MHYVYKTIEEYNWKRKRKVSIVFDDMVVDKISKKKLNQTVTELIVK